MQVLYIVEQTMSMGGELLIYSRKIIYG